MEQVDVLDRLFTQSVTALIDEGLVSLADIAVDGTKVRASASKGSFRGGGKLLEIEAARRAAPGRTQGGGCERSGCLDAPRPGGARPSGAGGEGPRREGGRAALDRLNAERKERRKTHPKDEARKSERKASLSDPDARAMRSPDGAFHSGYNAKIAAPPGEGVIVSIDMTDRRNDAGLATPMVDDIARRYGRTPDRLLVDTNYATGDEIAALAGHAAGPVQVYTPPPAERDDVKPATLKWRERRRALEPDSVRAWRARMASKAGQAVYALRKRIERINADRKNHGFGFIPVRGLIKAKAVALWHALANNIMAAHRLRAKAA